MFVYVRVRVRVTTMSVVGEGADDEGPEGGDREEPGRALEPEVVGRELEGARFGEPNGEEQAEGKSFSFFFPPFVGRNHSYWS